MTGGLNKEWQVGIQEADEWWWLGEPAQTAKLNFGSWSAYGHELVLGRWLNVAY